MVPEKTKTMLMQNLGEQTKSIMVFSEVGYRKWAGACQPNKRHKMSPDSVLTQLKKN